MPCRRELFEPEPRPAATLAGSRKTSAILNPETDVQVVLRMNDSGPWKRSFQFRPFAGDVLGAAEAGATANRSTNRAETQRAHHGSGRA
jgi:hypothetical protein